MISSFSVAVFVVTIPFLAPSVMAAGLSDDCKAALESRVTRTLLERLEGHGARHAEIVLMTEADGASPYAGVQALSDRGLTPGSTTGVRVYHGGGRTLIVQSVTGRISDLRDYLESDYAESHLYWGGLQFSQAAVDRWLASHPPDAAPVTPPRPPINVPGINLPRVHRLVLHALKTRPGDIFSISVDLKNPLTLDERVELEYLGAGPARAQYYRERVAAHHAEVRHLIEEIAQQPGVVATVNFDRNPYGVTLRGPIGLFEPLFTHRDVSAVSFTMPMPPLPRP